MIEKYRHIIWDWNGTLLNDVDFCRKIINKILIQYNLNELSLERYKEIFTFPVENYYKAAGLDFTKTSFKVLGKIFIDEYELNRHQCSLYSDSIDLLSSIHQKGIKQSVLSAYKQESLIKILDEYSLTQYFDFIIGSDNIYAGGKTHLGLNLIKKLDIKKDEILFIGDTLHDYEVAVAMGVNSILIADGHQSKEKLNVNGILVLDNLFELKSFLSI
ncbi:MAG TPA: HAD family hydrolase [Ignavibacteriales bacterium]|nr:HAD family hydrolase [Ignavibacteriales bacterium]